MAQDQFNKYERKSQPVDSFNKYERKIEPTEKPITQVDNVKLFNENEPEKVESGNSIWDWLTTSYLPEKLNFKGINYENKNPLTIGKSESEPETYAGGFAKGLQESLYENVIRPSGSPLGASLT
ncbi:MAG: hypothetical protein ACRD9Q_07780, partial [Nitrososphaeraceae archaeon]